MTRSAKRKKNFIVSVGLTIFLWLILGFMVWFVDPVVVKNLIIPNSYIVFLVTVWLAQFFTFSLVLKSPRRGLLLASGLTGFLFLKSQNLANPISLVLILAIIVTLEVYLSKR